MASTYWFDALESMTSVVMAEFDHNGQLLRGNAGLHRICPADPLARHLTSHPNLLDLVKRVPDTQGVVFQGLLTLGDPECDMVSLTATVSKTSFGLALLAGYDMAEFAATAQQLMELNDELTQTQHALARSKRELERREAAILQLSLTDALTGVGNRRHLDQTLEAEVLRAQRYASPLSLVMLDIDHFKRINDNWGHEAGDQVLQATGTLLRSLLRTSDTAFRMGGEEFVLVLPVTELTDAMKSAQRMRAALQAHDLSPLPGVTASFGVACRLPDESGSALLARADAALYRAKQAGRDRVVADLAGDHPDAYLPSRAATAVSGKSLNTPSTPSV